MAGKRTASRDINHTNWDQEDEPEEAGTFQRAPEDVLKTRVIKTARRKQVSPSKLSDGENKGGIFGNFNAFAKSEPKRTSAFSFLNNLKEKREEVKVNGGTSGVLMFKSDENDEYYGKLKGLNESVAKVIKKHVDENPFINLQPIFKDYERYLDELDKSKKPDDTKPTETITSFAFKPSTSNSNNLTPQKQQEKSTPQFSFGGNSAQNFTFAPKTTAFSFTTNSTPFTFSNVTKPPPTTTTTDAEPENEEDEPPKVEFTPVVEEGHVYKTRCKVFVKKDGSFAERGVGNLFLKPVPDSEKFQLIVRADTSLGNLLCNFILSESVPMHRMGKKDVMLVCLPTPESKPPPVATLFRVKTAEAAEELWKTLQKYKK